MESPAPRSGDTAPTPERRAAATLPAATLLAFTGGSLDAFLYLDHGHVFAGAMTGNAVLCGIALLGHDARDALRHALPLLAFFVGVWLSEFLDCRIKRHAVLVGLASEIAGLVAASLLPASFPDLLFVPWIALIAAYQIASFRKVDQFSYNSTFITGDLRTAIVGLYTALRAPQQEQGLRQARELGLVVLSFIAGAMGSALFASRAGNHLLWLPVGSLAVVFALTLRRSLLGQPASEHTQR